MANGGVAPSEVMEVAVKPAGLPLESVMVMTDTPDACRLKADLSASVGSATGSKFFIAHFLIGLKDKVTRWCNLFTIGR